MMLKSPTQKYTGANAGPQRVGLGSQLPVRAALELEGQRHLATVEAPKPGLGLSSFGEGELAGPGLGDRATARSWGSRSRHRLACPRTL